MVFFASSGKIIRYQGDAQHMKRILSLVLASMLIVSLAACGGKSEQPSSGGAAETPAATDTKVLFHTYNTAPYVTLDPSTEYSNGVMVLHIVYETLTR